ncbi:MAG TPA: ABC transporter permease [Gammaproteobacteria bacterium]
MMQTDLTEPRFNHLAAMEDVTRSTLDRVRAIPGVAAATATCCVPLHSGYGMVFNIIGREHERPFTGGGDFSMITGEYFETFEIPVLRGRVFDERDRSNSPPVIVISRELAERYWPEGEDPIGAQMLVGGGGALYPELADEPVREVIGIVDDVQAVSLSAPPRPGMYVPLEQYWRAAGQDENTLEWVVRTNVDPMRLSATIQDAIQSIRNMILRQGLLLVAIGTVMGLVAAFFLEDLLVSVLFGVEPRDLVTFAGIPLILILVALAAVSIPAYRATRVDSLTALRYE